MYCKECPYEHNDNRLACFSSFQPACVRCLSRFPLVDSKKLGLNCIDENDHFRINSEIKIKLKERYGAVAEEEGKKHKITRNLM